MQRSPIRTTAGRNKSGPRAFIQPAARRWSRPCRTPAPEALPRHKERRVPLFGRRPELRTGPLPAARRGTRGRRRRRPWGPGRAAARGGLQRGRGLTPPRGGMRRGRKPLPPPSRGAAAIAIPTYGTGGERRLRRSERRPGGGERRSAARREEAAGAAGEGRRGAAGGTSPRAGTPSSAVPFSAPGAEWRRRRHRGERRPRGGPRGARGRRASPEEPRRGRARRFPFRPPPPPRRAKRRGGGREPRGGGGGGRRGACARESGGRASPPPRRRARARCRPMGAFGPVRA